MNCHRKGVELNDDAEAITILFQNKTVLSLIWMLG